MDEGNWRDRLQRFVEPAWRSERKNSRSVVVQDMFRKVSELQCVWLKREWKEALMVTVFFVAVLAILIFLCFTGTTVLVAEASSLS